jgi:predicted double-glycine peptidase
MALTYLGRPLPYNRLLKTLRVQPGVGAPFSNLQALARLNITVIDEQGTLLDLHRYLANGWPCIVPVKSGEMPYWENIDTNHAVVVVGIEPESVYLNDPAFANAPLQVRLGNFDLAWFEHGEHYAVLAP